MCQNGVATRGAFGESGSMEALQAIASILIFQGTQLSLCVLLMNSNQVVNLLYSPSCSLSP